MPSYSNAIATLSRAHEAAHHWASNDVLVSVATSMSDDTEMTINLSQTIGHGKRKPLPGNRNDSNCYWLPSQYNRNDEDFRGEVLYPIFSIACRDAGFRVRGNWSARLGAAVFSCWRSRFHDQQKSMEYYEKRERNVKNPHLDPLRRKRKSPLPVRGVVGNDTACTFKFLLYWDADLSRWFLPHQQSGSVMHCGHMHVNPLLIRLPLKVAGTPEEVEIAKDALNSEVSATATAALFEKRTGTQPEWHQIQYLKTKERKQLLIQNNRSGCNPSAADRLIAQLTNDEDKSFVCLYADYSTGLLKVKTKKKTKKFTKDSASSVEDFTHDLGDDADSPEELAETLSGRDNLKCSETGQILLAIAWTSDESRRKFDMFPEVIGGDDTEETNSEERPVYTLLGMDNNNKSFPVLWAFMPSKAQWVFTWIYRHALPSLHPGTALQRVQLVLSDADAQETRAIEAIIGEGGTSLPSADGTSYIILPRAFHRWCGWYRIDRNFLNGTDYHSALSEAKNSSIESRVEIDVIVKWMWYFNKNYEDSKEIQFSFRLFQFYLSEVDQSNHFGEIKDSTRQKIREFLTKSFEPHGRKLFEAFFPVMTLGKSTTGMNEGTHLAYKKSALGPRPNHDIAEAAKKISQLTEVKDRSSAKKTAFDMNAAFAKKEDRDASVRELSDYCNEELQKEVNESSKYEVYCETTGEFYVKKNYDEYDSLPSEDLDLQIRVCEVMMNHLNAKAVRKSSRKKFRKLKERLLGNDKGALPEYLQILYQAIVHVVPRFEHTRVLKILQLECGELVLVCSCGIFKKKGHACRHMYRLLGRCPGITDSKIRWHIGYSHHYGVDTIMSQHYQGIRDSFDHRPGIPITTEEANKICERFHTGFSSGPDWDFFERSHNRICLRGKDNYWHNMSHHFPDLDPRCFGCNDQSDVVSSQNDHDTLHVDSAPLPVRGVPPAANSQVACLSQYTVPSQSQNVMNSDGSDEEDSFVTSCPLQGRDSYLDFLPHYQRLCKLADAQGSAGRGYLKTLLNHGTRELDAMAMSSSTTTNGTMASFPKLSNKKVARRKKKATSPTKK